MAHTANTVSTLMSYLRIRMVILLTGTIQKQVQKVNLAHMMSNEQLKVCMVHLLATRSIFILICQDVNFN